MSALALVALGYLLGAVPTGLVVGRLVRGIDIRKYGSGKVGATNTLRTLGVWPSVVVFLGDVGKAAAAVLLARSLDAPAIVQSLAGVAAVVGHCWSVYIGFGGGRGVASTLGAVLATAPLAGLFGGLAFVATVARSRYVSLGSLAGAALGAAAFLGLIATGLLDPGYAPLALGPVVVFVRHADNIQRLRAGTERKLGEKAERRAGSPALRDSTAGQVSAEPRAPGR